MAGPWSADSALQDLLVSISFLIILAIVNSYGSDRFCRCGSGLRKFVLFIMLISSAFMQSMSAFVARIMAQEGWTGQREALL